MNLIFSKLLLIFLLVFLNITIKAASSDIKLDKFGGDISDINSLQNGAKLFVNYCYGCHSLSLMRYDRISEDLDIDVDYLKKYSNNNGVMKNTMSSENGERWFGISPPDLSLVARSRGNDWIYTYLRSYYLDTKARWNVNNKLFANTSMPNVLEHLKANSTEQEFNKNVTDIVNFLSYVSEPIKLKRYSYGVWVISFLAIFFLFTYALKREYWKDVYEGKWKARD